MSLPATIGFCKPWPGLIQIMERHMQVPATEPGDKGHWSEYRGSILPSLDTEPTCDPDLFGALIWRQNGVAHIDVRGLEPPCPLLAVLRLIERPGSSGEVIFHHDRDPMLLYPELAERNWTSERLPANEGEIRLRLLRRAAG